MPASFSLDTPHSSLSPVRSWEGSPFPFPAKVCFSLFSCSTLLCSAEPQVGRRVYGMHATSCILSYFIQELHVSPMSSEVRDQSVGELLYCVHAHCFCFLFFFFFRGKLLVWFVFCVIFSFLLWCWNIEHRNPHIPRPALPLTSIHSHLSHF